MSNQLDPRFMRAARVYPDDIEPDEARRVRMRPLIRPRELDQLSLLSEIHSIHCSPVVLPGPGFHFHDHEAGAIPGNDIDLAETAAPSPRDDFVALSRKLTRGQGLAPLT